MKCFTLTIVNIKKETEDTVTIFFKQPGLKKIKYLSGQYLTVIFRINNRRYVRPYSFSSAPGIDSTLNITVKRVPGGIVSNHIVDKLNIGDMVEVFEPMGYFVLPDNWDSNHERIVLWGAGSGITPLFSIAKYALSITKLTHVTVVYGNRNSESVIFKDDLQALALKYNSSLSLWHFLTQNFVKEDNPYIVQGRISPEKILSVLNEEVNLERCIHYICGPIGLKESVINELRKYGISDNLIYTEDFELVRDPKQFNDIFTQTVKISHTGQLSDIEVVKGKSILEAGLDSMLELPYSCQTGSCLLCKAKVTMGEIKTIGIENLPEELSPNECLLCCSFPLSSDVCVEIIEN